MTPNLHNLQRREKVWTTLITCKCLTYLPSQSSPSFRCDAYILHNDTYWYKYLVWRQVRMATPVCCLIVVWILVFCRKTIGEYVYSSSAELRMLDEGEIDFINSVKSYISTERKKLDELDRSNQIY